MWQLDSHIIVMELILDIFMDAKKLGVESISQNEIKRFLGVPKKNIDRKHNIVYDLRGVTKQDIDYATLLLMKPINIS